MPDDIRGDHAKRVDFVLRQVGSRYFRGEEFDIDRGIDTRNPLEELMEREELAEREAAAEALAQAQRLLDLDVLPEPLVAQIREVVFDHFAQYEAALLRWLFAAGPDLLSVVKRLYAYAKHKDASLVWNMGFRDLGDLFGESHGTPHARQASLFTAETAAWQKTRTARAKMAKAQRGNRNRLGGKKAKPKTV